jgi:hypothetical protein
MEEKNKKYPEGHFVGLWIGISIAFFTMGWLPICIIMENPGLLGIGPALGMAVGVAIGQSIEEKYKSQGKIKPLTKEEKKTKKVAVITGIMILFLGLVTFLALYLLR